jgi:hypothetical protein
VNPAELWDEAARRQRVLARRHDRLAGLIPGTPAYEHQVERVFVATDELAVVLDEIDAVGERRRAIGAVALVLVAAGLAVAATAGTAPVLLWSIVIVFVLAAAGLAASARWRFA